jgi:hypothetical protein
MKTIKIIRLKRFWQVLAIIVIDAVFFTETNASSVAPIVLVLGFVLLMLTSYELLYGLLSLAKIYGLPVRHKHHLSLYLSAVMAVVIALQSIGELTARELIVLIPLVVLVYIYSVYLVAHNRT